MWVSKIATCLLISAMASMVAADAFVPASGLHHRKSVSPTTTTNNNNKHPYHNLSIRNKKQQQQPHTLKTTEDENAEPIPRGGGVGKASDPPPPLPTLKDYRKFAIPCLGLWVAQPLLSLVDTAFVGLSAAVPAESASQLAALGPATTFFDGATYLFAFLNVATTNLYSTARAQSGEASNEAEAVVRTASRVAARCGIGIMLFLLAFARPLLALYIGELDFLLSCSIFCRLFSLQNVMDFFFSLTIFGTTLRILPRTRSQPCID